MSFDTDVIKPGRGRALRVDISLDNFATVAYRYSDVSGVLDGTNQYTARVLDMGSVRRALGQNRIAASTSTSLTLSNADGGVDWLCGMESIASSSSARFRIYVSLYDPTASPLAFTAKLLGEFVLASWPTQDNATVRLSLADDFAGKLGNGLLLPTLRDWQAVGTTSNNPFKNAVGHPSSVTIDTPIQLAFGEDWVLAFPHLIPWQNQGSGSPYYRKIIIPLYSTTDLSAVSQDLVSHVNINRLFFSSVASAAEPVQTGDVLFNNWTVEKSPTITKGGLSFQIVYLVVPSDLGNTIVDPNTAANYYQLILPFKYQGGYQQQAVDEAGGDYVYAATVKKWIFKGLPMSQRTNAPAQFGTAHAVDVVRDLVSTYASSTVDTVSAGRVKLAFSRARCAGVVQPWATEDRDTSGLPMSLRQELSRLAQSSDFDVFFNWSGQVAFAADIRDFTTATQASGLVEILETDLNPGTRRWIASDGERNAPFNRFNFEGGKASLVSTLGGEGMPFQGPFDIEDSDIAITTRVIEVVIQQGWSTYRQQHEIDIRAQLIDNSARDMVAFSMHIGGLRLELGDYFKLNWTRGPQLGSPYAGTVFQCESITYSPFGDDTVEIEAVWRNDTVTERQYLLDDETLLAHADITITTTASPDGSNKVTLGATAVIANLEVGSILVLRDTTQAADVFTRNGAWRITNFDPTPGASFINIAPNGEGNYPATGTVASGQWAIFYGATNYPTVVTNPTNYPSGGDMYGKATSSAGLYSNAATGNRLING